MQRQSQFLSERRKLPKYLQKMAVSLANSGLYKYIQANISKINKQENLDALLLLYPLFFPSRSIRRPFSAFTYHLHSTGLITEKQEEEDETIQLLQYIAVTILQ